MKPDPMTSTEADESPTPSPLGTLQPLMRDVLLLVVGLRLPRSHRRTGHC